MDSLKLPMREIRKKYTKSELAYMAWDSRQRSYNMQKKFKRVERTPDVKKTYKADESTEFSGGGVNNGVIETNDSYKLPGDVNNGVAIPKKFFNEEGEIDLRRATGDEAVAYLRAVGINVLPQIRF